MHTSARTTMAVDRIRILPLQPTHSEPLLAMLRRCSRATLYHRFHGVTDGVAYVRQALESGAHQDAYGAWSADSCVGIASMHTDGPGDADIGVLVEDAWQWRGVGAALVRATVRRARERGLKVLRADVLADNQFIVPLLARIGPIRTTVGCGVYTVLVSLDMETGAVAPMASQPEVRSGTCQHIRLPMTLHPSWRRVSSGEVK